MDSMAEALRHPTSWGHGGATGARSTARSPAQLPGSA